MLSKKQRALLDKINKKRNGAYFKMQYSKSLANKTLAKYKNTYLVTKITTISIRKGVRYSNLKSVKEYRYNNLPLSNRECWYHHIDNTLVKHNKKDEYYVQVFPNKFGKPTTQYFVNGKPVTTEELYNMGIMQPSFWSSREEKPLCMTINISDIIEIF